MEQEQDSKAISHYVDDHHHELIREAIRFWKAAHPDEIPRRAREYAELEGMLAECRLDGPATPAAPAVAPAAPPTPPAPVTLPIPPRERGIGTVEVEAPSAEFVRDLRGLAYNAAGLAVAHALLRRNLQSVSLVRRFDGARVIDAQVFTMTKGPIWRVGMSGAQEYRAVEKEAIILVAGEVGMELGVGTGGLTGRDKRDLRFHLQYLAAEEDGGDSTLAQRAAIQEQVTRTARALLTKHRRALHRVANALERWGTLSGKEVRTLLREEKHRHRRSPQRTA